jgi:hypothetical protein
MFCTCRFVVPPSSPPISNELAEAERARAEMAQWKYLGRRGLDDYTFPNSPIKLAAEKAEVAGSSPAPAFRRPRNGSKPTG